MSVRTGLPAPPRVPFYWLAAVIAWFAALGLRPLFNPDEGRYAEIPREMLGAANFVVPRLNDLVYLEKPPLQYWLTALGFRLLGISPFSARLVTALAAVAGVGIVYTIARRLWTPERAEAAALMCASMLLYVFMGQLLTLDMLLSVELLAAVALFCAAQACRTGDPARSDRLALGCWAAMAAATLTKGLIGLALPGAILVVYTLVCRDLAVWRHLALVRGAALYTLLTAPWFLLVERAHPGALWFLIVHEHFERYLTTVHARYQPPWYFVPVLLLGILPWLPQGLRALATGWRASVAPGRFDPSRLLWIAAMFVFAFFSASDSKLAPYVLPILPLLALLGSTEAPTARTDLRRAAIVSTAVGSGLLLAVATYPSFHPPERNLALYRSAWPWLAVAGALVAATGTLVLARQATPWLSGVRRLAAAHFAAALLLATAGAATLTWKYSGAVVLPELTAGLARAPQAVIYAFRTYDWTLPVYTGRMLVPVEWRGELDYGLGHEPDKGIAEFAEFARRWQGSDQAFAIVEPPQLVTLREAGLPFVIAKASPELVLIERQSR